MREKNVELQNEILALYLTLQKTVERRKQRIRPIMLTRFVRSGKGRKGTTNGTEMHHTIMF